MTLRRMYVWFETAGGFGTHGMYTECKISIKCFSGGLEGG
jgi:hypothetical protein